MPEINFVDHSWKVKDVDPTRPVYLLMHCATRDADGIYRFSDTFKSRLGRVLNEEQAVPVIWNHPGEDLLEAPLLAAQNTGIVGFIKNEEDEDYCEPPQVETIIRSLERDYPATRYIIGGGEFHYSCPGWLATNPRIRRNLDHAGSRGYRFVDSATYTYFGGCVSRLLHLSRHGVHISVDPRLCILPKDDWWSEIMKQEKGMERSICCDELPGGYVDVVKVALRRAGIQVEE